MAGKYISSYNSKAIKNVFKLVFLVFEYIYHLATLHILASILADPYICKPRMHAGNFFLFELLKTFNSFGPYRWDWCPIFWVPTGNRDRADFRCGPPRLSKPWPGWCTGWETWIPRRLSFPSCKFWKFFNIVTGRKTGPVRGCDILLFTKKLFFRLFLLRGRCYDHNFLRNNWIFRTIAVVQIFPKTTVL
jgi:hypothetical protein